MPRPSARHIREVARHVGDMYPAALADPFTSASQRATFEGLERKIEHGIENRNRGRKRIAEEVVKGKLKRATSRTTNGCPDWQPALTNPVTDYEEAKKTFGGEYRVRRGAKSDAASRAHDTGVRSN